ncbi:MAG: tetratricopeptide repeat protein [Caldimicrobium sp.]|jgi:tetratricopeptide (TPR) repeat protein|nr:tetratricopeptide repeat protein [Caldimicrobium sp.]
MSKLGEILEKLREKKIDKRFSRNIFEHQIEEFSYQRKKNIALRILLILLFFSSVIGGYLTVKILENFVSIKKNNLGQKEALLQRNALTKSKEALNVTHTNMEDTKKESVKANEGTKTAIATNTTKRTTPTKFPTKTEEGKKEIKPTKKTKEKPLFAKKPHTDVYSPQEGPPILREEGLLKNLLLNAEEEVAKGNYQSAKVFYERYLAYRQEPEVYNNYGSVLFLLGDYKSAEKAFAKALSLRQDPTFKLNLIMAKLKLNQYGFACQMFRESQKELEKLEEATLVKDICSSRGF